MISLKTGLCLQAVGTALILAASGLSAQTAAILPFETDFESDEGYTLGPLASDGWWQLGSGLDASIIAPGAASSQTLSFFGGDWLDLLTDSGNAPVSWIDFYLKPVFVDPLELPEVIETEQSAVTGFVKVNTQGEVYAIDGDGLGGGNWVPSGELRNLQGDSSADWIRLTYRLDYTTKKWDLFVDGEIVMVDLGFLDQSISSLGSFSARADGETATQLDYFYAGNENPLYVDTSNDGLPDDWLIAQGLSIYSNQRSGDSDLDGLDNLLEYRIASDAGNPDSDGDGVHDGAEYLAGADPITADAYSLSTLPFTENFETYAAGSLGAQGNWTVEGTSAEVQSADVWGGSSALSLGGDTSVSNALDGSGQSVVWIDLYLKPTAASESPELAGDAAVGYYFNEEGRPIVFDGSGGNGSGFWKLLDAAQSSDWRRVTVKMDYGAQAYDFYLDGERLGAGLGFAHAQPFISRISASGSTMVDDISVDTIEPAALDDDRDGSTNAEEIAAGTNPTAFDTDGDGLADSLEILWGLDPNVVDATLAQPIEVTSGVYVWTTSFAVSEGYTSGVLAGQNGWAASGQNEVTTLEEASISDDPATDAVLERMAGMGELRRVWISFRAKLIAGDLPTLELDTDSFAGAFGASSASTLAVWDDVSADWTALTTSADLTEWNDYALYFDYVDQVWTLCLNGEIVADGLSFRDQNLVTFSRFKALQAKVEEATADFEAATAYFDDIRFANTEPANMDFDGDGLLNDQERQLGSDLYSADTDGDGMDDLWEFENGLNLLVNDAGLDADNDGLSNGDEYAQGSDPQAQDSDGDGYMDMDEFYAGTSAIDALSAPEAVGLGDWSVADVGSVDGAKGYIVDGKFVLYAEGSGISRDDRIGYFYQEFTGNFSVSVRVHSIEAGIIGMQARESLDDSAVMATGMAQERGGYRFYSRTDPSVWPSSPNKPGKHFPNTYLKIERDGSRFAAYRSTDGINWIQVGDETLVVGDTMLAGIAFGSGSNSVAKRAVAEIISVVRDSDSDGISDADEAAYGTSPVNADTDGDGVGDYDEIFVIFSDPLTADFDGTSISVAAVAGSTYVNSLGDWYADGDVVYAKSLRGWLEYEVNPAEDGSFRLDVTGAQRNAYSSTQRFDLAIYVDGQFVGADYLEAPYPDASSLSIYLPYLQAGAHTIRIEWLNGEPGSSLELHQVELSKLGGNDTDANGVVDWLDNHLQQTSDFDVSTVTTLVSPYTLEGSSPHPGFVSVASDYVPDPLNPETILVQQGLVGEYFAHIELSPLTDTQLVVEEQSGLLSYSKTIVWEATNLLETPELLLRKDDSLLLSAYTTDYQTTESVSIVVLDASSTQVASYSLTAAEAVPHAFEQSGEFTVEATLTPASGAPLVSTTAITVAGVNFGTAPRVVVGNSREWTVPGLSAQAAVQADTSLSFEEMSPKNGDRRFKLGSNANREATVLARLGDENGPIIARTTVYPIVDYEYTETHWLIVDTFDDGTELWSASLNLGGDIPDDLSVKIRIFKAGVTFLDGTVEKIITKDDFDELGVYRYYMLRPKESRGSTCHTTTIYQGGEQIAAPY